MKKYRAAFILLSFLTQLPAAVAAQNIPCDLNVAVPGLAITGGRLSQIIYDAVDLNSDYIIKICLPDGLKIYGDGSTTEQRWNIVINNPSYDRIWLYANKKGGVTLSSPTGLQHDKEGIHVEAGVYKSFRLSNIGINLNENYQTGISVMGSFLELAEGIRVTSSKANAQGFLAILGGAIGTIQNSEIIFTSNTSTLTGHQHAIRVDHGHINEITTSTIRMEGSTHQFAEPTAFRIDNGGIGTIRNVTYNGNGNFIDGSVFSIASIGPAVVANVKKEHTFSSVMGMNLDRARIGVIDGLVLTVSPLIPGGSPPPILDIYVARSEVGIRSLQLRNNYNSSSPYSRLSLFNNSHVRFCTSYSTQPHANTIDAFNRDIYVDSTSTKTR